MTPLVAAIKNGSLECVKILIEHGANYNMVYNYGQTALHFAALFKRFEILKYLYTNCKIDPFLRNEDNDTAYEIAALKGDISMQKWVEEQDSSSIFANQLLNELEDEDEVSKKKSKKKKPKKKLPKSMSPDE